jgi:hypothetical protein
VDSESWADSKGNQAAITWQSFNDTLSENFPPATKAATGENFAINHANNGSVQVLVYRAGQAVLYARIDPHVLQGGAAARPDVPDDMALVSQAERLLAAF